MIPTLMNAKDSFEIVRDKIAEILAVEIQNQMALATTAGKDPNDYYARVYVERARAFEQFLNVPVADESPLINVTYQSSDFDGTKGNTVSRQASSTTYNIDCYGYAPAQETAGGQECGDMLSNFAVQKAIRIVRNIIMASEYVVLDLQKLVWKRWISNINIFGIIIDNNPVQNVIGARISLSVEFNEFAPQAVSVPLEYVSVGVSRLLDGQVIVNADYDYS